MADNNWDIEEENDDDDIDYSQFKGREGTIYLIDASIFDDGVENFKTLLDCVEAGLLNGVILNDKDLYAVVLYNTQHSPAAKDADVECTVSVPKNMAIFMPMKTLTKDSIQYLKNFKESEDFFDFENSYGTGATASFPDVLWLCSHMVMNCGYKLRATNVVLFTNTELPHAADSPEIQKSLQRGQDFLKNHIYLRIVPMVDEFDYEPFYKEFCCISTDMDPEAFRVFEPAELRHQLLNRVYQRFHRSSCQRYLNVSLADGIEFSCGVYGFTRKSKLPQSVSVIRDTNELVISKRVLMCEEYNEETEQMELKRKVLPGETFKCQNLGGKEVIFTSEELAATKSLVPPGIRVLGFKPLDALPQRCFIKKIVILQPDEQRIKGSTKLFRALWQKCLEKQKYILCVLTYRRKVAPRYAALVPQSEDDHGNDGFRIIFMPMMTDYNHLDAFDRNVPEVSPLGQNLFNKLAKKLKFDYKPDLFTDPHIQTMYSNLEAFAYDEVGTELEDTTLPDSEYQDAKLQMFPDAITGEFGTDPVPNNKRAAGAAADGEGNRAKAPRKELTDAEIEEAVANGRVQIVTVQNLKDYLKSKGRPIPTKANKQDLVQIVLEIMP